MVCAGCVLVGTPVNEEVTKPLGARGSKSTESGIVDGGIGLTENDVLRAAAAIINGFTTFGNTTD